MFLFFANPNVTMMCLGEGGGEAMSVMLRGEGVEGLLSICHSDEMICEVVWKCSPT